GLGSRGLPGPLWVAPPPGEPPSSPPPGGGGVERFLRAYGDACLPGGVTPLIENVPPVLRMRAGGVYLSRIGGHWRDLLAWRERIPALRFTFDTSHAALFASFCAAYPTLHGQTAAEELDLARYAEELGPDA